MPVRNEAWILPTTLSALVDICDVVIVADQCSTDGSRDICRAFEKVVLIDNPREGHSNQVRWELLDAARQFDGNNLLVSVDADEYFPPQLIHSALERAISDIEQGTWLEFRWIQLWKSIYHYRDDESVWSVSWKPIAILDDRMKHYRSDIVINDHTSRVPGPETNPSARVTAAPLIHLQWVAWQRAQMKQAWYRSVELVEEPGSFMSINSKYSVTLEQDNQTLSHVPEEWLAGVSFPDGIADTGPGWYQEVILALFDKHGIEFFEPLQIWHNEELRARFEHIMGREPRSHSAASTRSIQAQVRSFIGSWLPVGVKKLVSRKSRTE